MLSTSFDPVTSAAQFSEETQLAFVNLWNDFWSLVAVTSSPDDCWLWAGKNLSNGYGAFKHAGISVHAYKMAWLLTHPEAHTGNGFCIRHLCGNRPCCNPHHLSLGTPKENAHDRITHGTQTRGESHPSAKFTDAQIYKILCDHADGIPAIVLAEQHGVGYDTIWRVLTRTQWIHVPLPPHWKGYRSSRQMDKARYPRGEDIVTSRFTEAAIYQMRVDFLNGSLATEISTAFDTTPTAVCNILRGKTWAHVPFPQNWSDYQSLKQRNMSAYYAKRWANNRARKHELQGCK